MRLSEKINGGLTSSFLNKLNESNTALKLGKDVKEIPVEKEKILVSPGLNREIQAGIDKRRAKKELKEEDTNPTLSWDRYEEYTDEEIEKITNMLDNVNLQADKHEGNKQDGYSVRVKDLNSGFAFWMDYSQRDGDIYGDWNQYIFFMNDVRDKIKQAMQTAYTDDWSFFSDVDEVCMAYLLDNNLVSSTDNGMMFESEQPEEGKQILKESKPSVEEIVVEINKNLDDLYDKYIGTESIEDKDNIAAEMNMVPVKMAQKYKLVTNGITVNESEEIVEENNDINGKLIDLIARFRQELENLVYEDPDFRESDEALRGYAYDLVDTLGSAEIMEIAERLFPETEEIVEESEELVPNTREVASFHVEDMGGHTMAVFGKLKDGLYFAGNEDGLTLYDVDVWPFYTADDTNWEELETKHAKESINAIDNTQEYYDIIKQTNFYSDSELEEIKNNIENGTGYEFKA